MKPYIVVITIITLTVLTSAQSKYQLDCYKPLLTKSAEIMMKEVGTIESENNSGARIRLYQLSVGLPDHSPYCAAGQYFCFKEATNRLRIAESYIPIPRTGLANAVYNSYLSNGRKTSYSASVHDLIVWRKNNSFHGHIERVISTSAGGWVLTIGFNSSSMQNGRKIEGVFVQRRNIYHALGKLRIRGLVGFKGKELL